ncbi:diguanylate cyclase [Cognatishimia sp. MH4019]|uniref:diguanylate cyclase n=1 Tax=Cognatishimia sp. MH4019 TaxID=2854030 RepID=UPI001CD4FA8F|nr:diguanylate cyclase [Cognatishimia sp. MH4019]
MPGRVLIIDPIATNRILLKVRLAASNYRVLQASTLAEGVSLTGSATPDLIVIDQSLIAADVSALRGLTRAHPCPIVVLTPPEGLSARAQMLAAGAADCLQKPINDALLLARLRSLMRFETTRRETGLRDDTSRALGLAEDGVGFAPQSRVSVVTAGPAQAHEWAQHLRGETSAQVNVLSLDDALDLGDADAVPDLFLLALSDKEDDLHLQAITELRSRAATRSAAIIAVTPQDAPVTAAMALDLGADDVTSCPFDAAEIGLRITTQLRHKHRADQLRATVQHGLQAAVTDPLTGLFNRRYALAHLKQIAERAAEEGAPYAVMILDIDRFKLVNDSHGHAAGDSVLRALSSCLSDNLRSVDMVARLGGEEFVIALPDTGETQARIVAERLRQLVCDMPVVVDAKTTLRISVSIGLTISLPEVTECADPNDLLEQADMALYGAKDNGRNQVIMSPNAA